MKRKPGPANDSRRSLLLAGLMACAPGIVTAQSVESDVTPESSHLVKDDASFAMSSIVPDDTLAAAVIEDERDRFAVKFGFVVMPMDYTSFEQDSGSRQQVGNQEDTLEARSLRLSARGHFELFRTWNYMLSYEYKGFDQTSADDWNTTDFRIGTVLGPHLGTLTLGKIKEPFSYEMVGDAANLPHHERLLSPFFRSRNDGVMLGNAVLGQRATWAVGWYNDWWTQGDSWSSSGNDFAARFTSLPVWSGEGENYLHLGASMRYAGADDDQLRYKGKPASNVADDFVDTGKLAGEHRPYDRKAGYARRILPQGRWGAVELIGRYGKVDLDDGSVRGGTMDGWWAGVNWWANNRWKASVGYGTIDLDRFGIEGNAQTLLTRLQWVC